MQFGTNIVLQKNRILWATELAGVGVRAMAAWEVAVVEVEEEEGLAHLV